MQILSGKPIAENVLSNTKERIQAGRLSPGLAVVMVGADPASEIYVGLKEKAAAEIGIRFEKHVLPVMSETQTVQTLIRELNNRNDIHGIIVQLPLPKTLDTDQIIATIAPRKDADGFHPETVEHFLAGREKVPPVFPRAILALLESTGIPLEAKRAFIFANSNLFARVMGKALESIGIIAENSVRLSEEEVKQKLPHFDIIISAKGDPHFLKGDMLRPGVIVIDGGITRVGTEVFSDADQASFKSIDGFITPVPGGVGPVTVAFLMSRVAELTSSNSEAESGSIL